MGKTFRKPYRIRKKKSIFRNRFFWLGILAFVIVGGIFYLLFFSETFQVKKIIITGEEKVSTEDIKLFVGERLEGKILFFKTKSILLVSLDEIKKDILNNFIQIGEIEISRGFPNALNIVVAERLGIAIWCCQDCCFLLDDEGVIFEEAPPEGSLIKIIDNRRSEGEPSPLQDEQNIKPFALGERVIEKEELNQILKIEFKLKNELKIPLKEISMISENRTNAETLAGWEIYFNLKKDLDLQLTRLKLVLEEKIPPGNREDLQYIDLRFEKGYYR